MYRAMVRTVCFCINEGGVGFKVIAYIDMIYSYRKSFNGKGYPQSVATFGVCVLQQFGYSLACVGNRRVVVVSGMYYAVV